MGSNIGGYILRSWLPLVNIFAPFTRYFSYLFSVWKPSKLHNRKMNKWSKWKRCGCYDEVRWNSVNCLCHEYLPCIHPKKGYGVCRPNNSKWFPEKWDYDVKQWNKKEEVIQGFFLILGAVPCTEGRYSWKQQNSKIKKNSKSYSPNVTTFK